MTFPPTKSTSTRKFRILSDLSTTNEVSTASLNEKRARLRELRRLAKLRHDQVLHYARHDFRSCVEYILKDEASGEKIILAALHKKWIEHIHFAWSHGLHAVILAPYGSGKTALISIGIPLFALGRNPSLRIVLVSANDNLARERLVLVRQYIDLSDEYHELFPQVKADENMGWTKGQLYLQRSTFSKDPSLSACGATSSAIGKRLDMLILDDINDAKNTLHQPKMREVIWRNYTGVYLSRLEPGGKVVVVATKWHEEDLVGMIMNNPEMRTKYAFLIQRVTENYDAIECETLVPASLPTNKVTHAAELDYLFKLHQNNVI